MYDVIPDIHGQSDKLKGALGNLGYRESNGAWRHSDPNRHVVFLGDFIDRGPDNREVIRIVRGMIEAGTAFAVMGNHELNAIHFHSRNSNTGEPLRGHSEKNLKQHASFLKEFTEGSAEAKEAIEWMSSLPLFLEFSDFRAVHACWNENVVNELIRLTGDGRLSEEQILDAANWEKTIFDLVETTTKGPELKLPDGFHFVDKGGHKRTSIRQKWWEGQANSWRKIAMSVPDLSQLPDEPLPRSVKQSVYQAEAKPVFFGHYWLTGKPCLQTPNAMCLDYSAGTDGPLVSYLIEPGQKTLSLERMKIHL